MCNEWKYFLNYEIHFTAIEALHRETVFTILIIFHTESDSINNSYQWKSPFFLLPCSAGVIGVVRSVLRIISRGWRSNMTDIGRSIAGIFEPSSASTSASFRRAVRIRTERGRSEFSGRTRRSSSQNGRAWKINCPPYNQEHKYV